MTSFLNLGMIGLDTSHVSAFAAILNDPGHQFHVAGGKIVAAFPGNPALDFELSYGRVEQYTNELKDKYNVSIFDSARAVAEACDAILLVSVDGRVHLQQFREIARFGKPVFIDKPFAVSSSEAQAIVREAEKFQVPLMSCSSLRYSGALTVELERTDSGEIIGADCFGPMALEPTQPGLFWYGIHSVEMLFRVMGKGCVSVTTITNDDYDLVTGVWQDGRIGTIRGNRKGNSKFGLLVHREQGTKFADVSAHPVPYYVSMLKHVVHMFHTGEADIDTEETVEIIRFIECANVSRISGNQVLLNGQ